MVPAVQYGATAFVKTARVMPLLVVLRSQQRSPVDKTVSRCTSQVDFGDSVSAGDGPRIGGSRVGSPELDDRLSHVEGKSESGSGSDTDDGDSGSDTGSDDGALGGTRAKTATTMGKHYASVLGIQVTPKSQPWP
jgi:hypothetical protein